MARRTAFELAGVGALAVAITWAFFRPSPAELWATLPAHHGAYADAVLLTWAIGHVSQSLFGLLAPLFDAPIFHPATHTLAFGDHMIGQAALGFPIWWATGNPVLEYNLLHLASYPAAVLAAFAYLRHGVRLSAAAALAGAIAFAFTPYRLHSPLWLQVLWVAFVPLMLLGWLTFVRTGRWSAWAAWVGCWAFHSLLGLYLALYMGLVMSALVAYALVAAPIRHERRIRTGLLAAPVAMGLLVAPTLLPYAQLRSLQGNVRSVGLDTRWTFLLPAPSTASARLLDLPASPGFFGPGLVVWMLAAVGVAVALAMLIRRRSAETDDAAFVAGAHLLGLALTLALVLAPVRLQQLVPGLDMIRVTNRAFFVTLLFLGALVAAGVSWCLERVAPGRLRAAVAVVLLALVALEAGLPPRERKAIAAPPAMPEAIAFLATLAPDTAVYEHVFGPDRLAVSMYHALFHRHAVPTGWSGFFTPGAAFSNIALFAFPSPTALEVLRRLHVGYVWTPFPTAEHRDAFAAALPSNVRTAGRFGTDLVLDVRAVPPLVLPSSDGTTPATRTSWRPADAAADTGLDPLRDGDPTTVWEFTAIDPLRVNTFAIDLGAAQRVAAVIVRTPRGLGDAIAVARLELSADGRQWTPFATFLPEPFESFFTAPPVILTLVARGAPQEARYLRFVAAGAAAWAGPWRIGELEVLTSPG